MKITYCYGRRDRMNSIGNSTLVFSTFMLMLKYIMTIQGN